MKNKKPLQIILSTTIFLVGLFLAIITSITVLFPALVIRTFGGLVDYSSINVFETGFLAPYWLVINATFSIMMVLYIKNKFPHTLRKFFSFITNFEVSAKIALIVIAVIVGIYASLSFHEIFEDEIYVDYRNNAKQTIENWQPSDITKSFTYHVRLFLYYVSASIFGNYKVVPFLSSISLLVLVYYITKELTKKRFAGLVAFCLVLQSGTFLIYDTSITYDSCWVLFYLLSLYMILKSWALSPVSFILSILSKHISVIFIPMSFFVIYAMDLSRKNKILLIITYLCIIIGGFVATNGFATKTIQTSFDWHDFWMAMSGISYQMRYDGLILVLLLPVSLSLLILTKKNRKNAQVAMVLISDALLSQPMLAALTVNSSEPYRFMPLVIFFAISFGILFSKPKVDVPV